MSGRPWTREERRLVRRLYGTEPTAALAARLGRTVKAVYLLASALRRTKNRKRWTVAAVERLARLVRAGHSDTELAARFKCDRAALRRWRRALGLPANNHNRRHRDKLRGKAADQLRRAGLRSMGELRVRAWGDHAARYGLPRELNPTAVKVVLALAAGARTRRQVVAALGRQWKAGNGGRNNLGCKGRNGSYLSWLIALGLVARTPRYCKSGRRGATQRESIYRLTDAAVSLLRGAGVVVVGVCSTPYCVRKHLAKGLCLTCYYRLYERRKRERQAVADLARITTELEAEL